MEPHKNLLLKVCNSINDRYALICFTIVLHSSVPLTEQHIIDMTKLPERKVRIALQLLLSHTLVFKNDFCIEDRCNRTWYISYTNTLNAILYRAIICKNAADEGEMICPVCKQTWSVLEIALLQFKCPIDSCEVEEHIVLQSNDIATIVSDVMNLDRSICPR